MVLLAPPLPSVAEVIKVLIEAEAPGELAEGGIVVGPTSHKQQKAGSISISQSSLSVPEKYTLTIRANVDITCQNPSVYECDKMQRWIRQILHQRGRTKVTTVSDGVEWLLHFSNIISGPHEGIAADTDDIREQLLVVDVLVGTGDAS